MFAGQGRRIQVYEVTTRDGFQIEPTFIPTAAKVALIDELSRTGLTKIEVTSFASPKAIPSLRDAEEVFRGITRASGVVYSCLVPNQRGAERALAVKVDEINLVMSVSETHNLANLRMTREQSYAQLAETIRTVRHSGIVTNASLSVCFGCPMEGPVAEAEVWRFSERLLAAGAGGISLCDTTGMAHPAQVAGMVEEFRRRFPTAALTLHLHNTRGMGLANILAALQAGADRFDASLGRSGRLPVCTGGDRQRLHRGPGPHAGGPRLCDGHRPRPLACVRTLAARDRGPRGAGAGGQGGEDSGSASGAGVAGRDASQGSGAGVGRDVPPPDFRLTRDPCPGYVRGSQNGPGRRFESPAWIRGQVGGGAGVVRRAAR